MEDAILDDDEVQSVGTIEEDPRDAIDPDIVYEDDADEQLLPEGAKKFGPCSMIDQQLEPCKQSVHYRTDGYCHYLYKESKNIRNYKSIFLDSEHMEFQVAEHGLEKIRNTLKLHNSYLSKEKQVPVHRQPFVIFNENSTKGSALGIWILGRGTILKEKIRDGKSVFRIRLAPVAQKEVTIALLRLLKDEDVVYQSSAKGRAFREAIEKRRRDEERRAEVAKQQAEEFKKRAEEQKKQMEEEKRLQKQEKEKSSREKRTFADDRIRDDRLIKSPTKDSQKSPAKKEDHPIKSPLKTSPVKKPKLDLDFLDEF